MEEPRHPVAGIDYPGTFQEFDEWFSSDEACLNYIAKLRWSKGFCCPNCGDTSVAVDDYGITLDAPTLMFSGFCKVEVNSYCKRVIPGPIKVGC